MADAQSTSIDDPANENPQVRFLRNLTTVFKDNRDLLPSLPEIFDSLLVANEEYILNKTASEVREENRTVTEREQLPEDNHLEAAQKQMKLMKERIQSLETELKNKETELGKMEKEIRRKEKKLSETQKAAKESNDCLQKAIAEKDEKIQQYSLSNDHLQKEIAGKDEKIQQYSLSLAQKKDELRATQTKMDSYKSRLASLSEKRVKQDQRLVEDTLGSNRQSELERDFSAFFDDDRIDACEKMQSIYHNKENDFVYIYYPRLACIILETAYEQAKRVHEAASDFFKKFTKIMIDCAAHIGSDFFFTRKMHTEGKYTNEDYIVHFRVPLWGGETECPKDIVDGMNLSLKENAHICNLDSLVNHVACIVFMKWREWCDSDKTCMFSPAWNLLEGLDKYIKACIRLTWRMVTQVPPMKLEYQCPRLNKDVHKKIGYNGNIKVRAPHQNQDEEIACYLWPGLLDGGGRRIRPGEVLCKVFV